MWLNELVFHLSFKTAALKLNILPATIGQLINPNITVIISPPRPCFLSRQLSMICDVHHAPIRLFVIDSEVVALRIPCKQRKEIRYFAKAADVDSLLYWKLKYRPECVW